METDEIYRLCNSLEKLIEGIDQLKIVCAIENDDFIEKEMLPDDFDLMRIGSMDPKDAMQLMFDMSKNFLNFQ